MTAPASELLALAERCEAATGPDQKSVLVEVYEALSAARLFSFETASRFIELVNVAAYLDAAMTLVPEGWLLNSLHQRPDGTWDCWFGTRRCDIAASPPQIGDPGLATPALALTAASLRALATGSGR